MREFSRQSVGFFIFNVQAHRIPPFYRYGLPFYHTGHLPIEPRSSGAVYGSSD